MFPKKILVLGPIFTALFLYAFVELNSSDGMFPKRPMQENFRSYDQDIPGSALQIKMVAVKGGSFRMGSNSGKLDERPEHQLSLDDFWMGAHEVTWDQYLLFSERRIDHVGNNAAGGEVELDIDAIASATTPYVDMSHGMGRKGFPVVNVTQHAALTFCKWLSAKTGNFYRLPTEAEWEYACRAGSEQPYSFGADSTALAEYAWYKMNSNNKYQPVGRKKPNAFGLYDMHGNVAEWTMDQYIPTAYATRENNSVNPWVRPSDLYPRVVRGGSWKNAAHDLRSSARLPSEAAWKRIDPQIPKSRWWFTNASHVGFRIVRPKNTPSKEEIEQYWLEAIDDY